jgi:putative FmdB family regulatory protein
VPTYEYLCDSCGNRYEKQESFSAKAKQKCPKCRKTANRVIFAPPVVFKGGGFYKTDSRRGDASVDSGSTTSAPDVAAASHGHSHGPGGHTHDAPAAASSDSSSNESSSSSTETAAAG